MKHFLTVCLLVVVLLGTFGIAFADVSGKVLTYEKEILNGNPRIKVTTEYTYPDGTKKLGVVRYSYRNFSRANVQKDVDEQCAAVIRYYIQGNREKVNARESVVVDGIISSQDSLIPSERITSIIRTFTDFTVTDLGITLQADGEILPEFR